MYWLGLVLVFSATVDLSLGLLQVQNLQQIPLVNHDGNSVSSLKQKPPSQKDGSEEKFRAKYPIGPKFLHPEYRVFAIGDIHGDFERAHQVLAKAGVVDPSDHTRWTAGNSILVQTGDAIDRGNDTIKLLNWLNYLDKAAKMQGGAVKRLFGNHEFMNVIGDWRYVSPGDINSFPEPHEQTRRESFAKDGVFGQMLLKEYELGFLHRGMRAYFQHAGLAPEWAKDELNLIAKDFLDFCFSTNLTETPISQSEWKEFYSSNGPLWNRQFSQLPEEEACRLAQKVKCGLGVDLLVFGHTPNLNGIVSRCDSSVIIIDTGLTQVYGGRPSVLELVKFYGDRRIAKRVHYLDGKSSWF